MTNPVVKTFELYQRARSHFVQTIAELVKRKENFDDIIALGGLILLRPLTLDVVPSISQTACIVLGRMASESKEVAESTVELDILPQIIFR